VTGITARFAGNSKVSLGSLVLSASEALVVNGSKAAQ